MSLAASFVDRHALGLISLHPGVLASVLLHSGSLTDWCMLERTATRAKEGVRCSFGAVRAALSEGDNGHHPAWPWEMTKSGDLVGLWHCLGEKGDLRSSDGSVIIDPSGCSLLHVALQAPRGPALAWLLSRPGAAKAAKTRNVRGQTALHLCARTGHLIALQQILRLPGVDIDAIDNYVSTALCDGIREEHLGIIEALLAAGADPNHFEDAYSRGTTPLLLAVLLKNVAIVQMLLASPGIEIHKAPLGREALDYAHGQIRDLLSAAAASAADCAQTGSPGVAISGESAPPQSGQHMLLPCQPHSMEAGENEKATSEGHWVRQLLSCIAVPVAACCGQF